MPLVPDEASEADLQEWARLHIQTVAQVCLPPGQMPTFGPIIMAPTISKNKFPSSETVDSNSNLAYIKLLHSVTNEYSRTAKNIEEKVNKKLEKMQKRRSELILQVEEQKRVS